MLQVADIDALIRESLCCLEAECDMLERIQPGHYRVVWIASLQIRLKRIETLIDTVEEQCLNEALGISKVRMQVAHQLTVQVKRVAKESPENLVLVACVKEAQDEEGRIAQSLVTESLAQESLIYTGFERLRNITKYLRVRIRSL